MAYFRVAIQGTAGSGFENRGLVLSDDVIMERSDCFIISGY